MPGKQALGSEGNRQRKAALVLGLLLLVVAVACEYPGVPHPLAAQAEKGTLLPLAPQVAIPTLLPTPTPPEKPGGSSGSRSLANVLASVVEVRLKDFRLDPDKITAKAGAITFVLKNEGRYTHDFRTEGSGIDERAPKVGQGRTFEWQVTLTPGTYRISCPISNHADRGMTGTLEVVP